MSVSQRPENAGMVASDGLMDSLAASLRGCPTCTARAGVPCDSREAFDFIHPDRLSHASSTSSPTAEGS